VPKLVELSQVEAKLLRQLATRQRIIQERDQFVQRAADYPEGSSLSQRYEREVARREHLLVRVVDPTPLLKKLDRMQ
jgi:hypothetical protein